VPLVFQISNVSFFVLSPALLYLNRQYHQRRALPLYFVSGLLFCVGGCQGCEKTRQVARVPHCSFMIALEAGSYQPKHRGKLGWETKQRHLFEALQLMVPAACRRTASSPVKPRGAVWTDSLRPALTPWSMPCSSGTVCLQECPPRTMQGIALSFYHSGLARWACGRTELC